MLLITWTDIGYGTAVVGIFCFFFVHWMNRLGKRRPLILLRPAVDLRYVCSCRFGQDEPKHDCRWCGGSGRLRLPRPSFSAPASEVPCADCLNGYHGLYGTDCVCRCHGSRKPAEQSMGGAA